MAYMTNREFAEHLFKQNKRNEYADALVKEVRRLREEIAEREKGCDVCHPDNRQYHFRGNPPNFCPYCGKSLKEVTHDG